MADCFEYLSEKKDIFDVIAAHDIIEHIPKKRVISLLKMVRDSLKKDGVFMIRVPNMDNPLSLSSRYGDFTHEVGYTQKSLSQVLKSAGFEDIKVIPSGTICVKSFRNMVHKVFVSMLHGFIRFAYYIQDFTVPKHLDKNLVIMARKK